VPEGSNDFEPPRHLKGQVPGFDRLPSGLSLRVEDSPP